MTSDPHRDDRPPVLDARGIGMQFGATRALDDVSLRIGLGECVALAGENGAGKSTLVKIVTGVHPHGSYTGEVAVDGHVVRMRTPREAESCGVVVVQQELTISPTLTVEENLLLGREPRRFGVVRRDLLRRRASEILAAMNLDIPPDTLAGRLGVAQQQMLEIARAISRRARLLVLDEPTSSLSTSETEVLFARLAELRAMGVSLLYISHRLDELQRIADRVSVLRDGRKVLDVDIAQANRDAIVHAMLGEHVVAHTPPATIDADTRPAVLSLREWSVPPVRAGEPAVHSVDLDVRPGEIAGIYGAVGAGRSELIMSLFGARPARGEMALDGVHVRISSPRAAVLAGIGIVTEDRKTLGLQPWMTAEENLVLAALPHVSRGPLPHVGRQRLLAEDQARGLGLSSVLLDRPITALSGGNQQKVLLGRALATKPRVLLLDEPTRGVDVGAKADLQRTLQRLAADGLAVVWVSSEAEELLDVADTIHVMRDGMLVAAYAASDANVALLVRTASSTGSDETVPTADPQ